MTNKPMLSVEREVIEKALRDALTIRFDTDSHVTKLRALLDKPEPERKPFAWYRVPKDFPLQGAYFPYIEGQSERDIQNSLEAEFGFNVKLLYDEPAAQHQGEPVVWVECSSAWLKAGGDCATAPRICVGREGISHLHPAHSNAEQPAPVAVVMPERKPQRITDEYARGWNGYDAEYKRLNGVKP